MASPKFPCKRKNTRSHSVPARAKLSITTERIQQDSDPEFPESVACPDSPTHPVEMPVQCQAPSVKHASSTTSANAESAVGQSDNRQPQAWRTGWRDSRDAQVVKANDTGMCHSPISTWVHTSNPAADIQNLGLNPNQYNPETWSHVQAQAQGLGFHGNSRPYQDVQDDGGSTSTGPVMQQLNWPSCRPEASKSFINNGGYGALQPSIKSAYSPRPIEPSMQVPGPIPAVFKAGPVTHHFTYSAQSVNAVGYCAMPPPPPPHIFAAQQGALQLQPSNHASPLRAPSMQQRQQQTEGAVPVPSLLAAAQGAPAQQQLSYSQQVPSQYSLAQQTMAQKAVARHPGSHFPAAQPVHHRQETRHGYQQAAQRKPKQSHGAHFIPARPGGRVLQSAVISVCHNNLAPCSVRQLTRSGYQFVRQYECAARTPRGQEQQQSETLLFRSGVNSPSPSLSSWESLESPARIIRDRNNVIPLTKPLPEGGAIALLTPRDGPLGRNGTDPFQHLGRSLASSYYVKHSPYARDGAFMPRHLDSIESSDLTIVAIHDPLVDVYRTQRGFATIANLVGQHKPFILLACYSGDARRVPRVFGNLVQVPSDTTGDLEAVFEVLTGRIFAPNGVLYE